MVESEGQFRVEWVSKGGAAQNPPDPRYPAGVDLVSHPEASHHCTLDLPYPSPAIGGYVVECRRCGLLTACTAAGRADDPRRLTIPCKLVNGMRPEWAVW